MRNFQYRMPTEVVLEAGGAADLAERCASFGQYPFVVTGQHSARANGSLARVAGQFPKHVVFDEVPENPTTALCDTGAAHCREAGCDFVIALGGGSSLDAGKAIAMLTRNPGSAAQYFGTEQFSQGALPIVALPTTAGTGSEVTPYAVLVDSETNTKQTISGRALFPRIALLDPELSRTMPRSVTTNTGLDALSQAMEGMLSKRAAPMSDLLAVEACRQVRQWLPAAVHHPDDLNARAAMLYAAMLSGCVIAQTGTTLVHGMGYYYTLEFGVPHGLANGLLLAPVFRQNAVHEASRVATLAAALGQSCDGSTEGAATAITEALHELMADLGVSPAARHAGVSLESLRGFAEHLHRDSYRFKNQVGSFSVDDLYRLFEASWQGR